VEIIMNKSVITAFLGTVSGFILGYVIKSSVKPNPNIFDGTVLLANPAGLLTPPIANVKIAINFELMAAAYEAFGADGAYAYLVENNIARDSRYGDHVINNHFLPEYEKYKRRRAEVIETITETTEPLQS
jgi:hypothetical protein